MHHVLRIFAIALATVLLAACGGSSTGDVGSLPDGGEFPSPTGGTLRIAVTDEPFPIEGVLEATVDIGRVEAHLQEEDRWVVLTDETFTINLIGLTNGIVEQIVDVAVDPGTYDQFRFITGPGRVVLDPDEGAVADEARLQEVTIDGTTQDAYVFTVEDGGVKFPSGPQTGIKVHVDPPIVVTTALSGDLLLEYDLGRNFVFNGPVYREPGVKRVLFTPSVKASNTSTNGTVTVLVTDDAANPLADAEVWLVDDAGTKVGTTSFTSDGTNPAEPPTGVAKISVGPGTYTLKADKFGFVEGEIAGVEISLANLTDAGTLALEPSNLVIAGIVQIDLGDPTKNYVLEGVAASLELNDATAPMGLTYTDATTTDASGNYSFDQLEEYDYDVSFSKDGFTTQDTTWAPSDGALDVLLDPMDESVDATVKDGTGTAVTATTLTVTATDGAGNTWSADTDANGVAAFTLPTGTYTFTASDGTTSYASSATAVLGDDDTTDTNTAVDLTPTS